MLIQKGDDSFSTFSDILTGYRLSRLLMTAVNSGLIETIGADGAVADEILAAQDWQQDAGQRFLHCLQEVGLIDRYQQTFFLSPFSRRFLLAASPASQVAALGFEERLTQNWQSLDAVLQTGRNGQIRDKSESEYKESLSDFISAMDSAATVRAKELWQLLEPPREQGVIIDVGAGSGTYLYEFLRQNPAWNGVFCDMPDVIRLARDKNDTEERVQFIESNLLDVSEKLEDMIDAPADLLLLSNLVHCQGRQETEDILERVLPALAEDGLVVVHDFFADQSWRGALYDLHMMLNTYNGRTYYVADIAELLARNGYSHTASRELPSGSTVLVGTRQGEDLPTLDPWSRIQQAARGLGFSHAIPMNPADVPSAAWVREKCRIGCDHYDRSPCCPPRTMDHVEFSKLLAEYRMGLVLAGEPPLQDYQHSLVKLEKLALQAGYHKALAFSAGPCSLCDECIVDKCPMPASRRPALEACGCDVYALAKMAGIKLQPIAKDNPFVQYVSMLLLE
ncbi:MAG: DUF2284 domain-containing protein [Kiritimatiellia bacterium]|jgi:predicted metal-binding protein|nr:DUF2284 domain-containing protein [Kiritimatiellia bacterium]